MNTADRQHTVVPVAINVAKAGYRVSKLGVSTKGRVGQTTLPGGYQHVLVSYAISVVIVNTDGAVNGGFPIRLFRTIEGSTHHQRGMSTKQTKGHKRSKWGETVEPTE